MQDMARESEEEGRGRRMRADLSGDDGGLIARDWLCRCRRCPSMHVTDTHTAKAEERWRDSKAEERWRHQDMCSR